MGWDEIYQHMAFCAYKQEMIDYQNIKDALVVLESYIQGQARDYEVRSALEYLDEKFGGSVTQGTAAFRKALTIEDEGGRMTLAQECVKLIDKAVNRRGGALGGYNSLG